MAKSCAFDYVLVGQAVHNCYNCTTAVDVQLQCDRKLYRHQRAGSTIAVVVVVVYGRGGDHALVGYSNRFQRSSNVFFNAQFNESLLWPLRTHFRIFQYRCTKSLYADQATKNAAQRWTWNTNGPLRLAVKGFTYRSPVTVI